MATDNKTSVLVESLLPDFLQDEGPKFQAFVKAYYEWMETTGQMTDRSKNLLNYQDIDETSNEFLDYFRREILSEFPQDILADKKLVYKRIKDLYRSKGSEESFKLLFRILFDEEIEFYYPGQDILRASDGRWVQETSIRVTTFTGNIELLAGRITGRTSGATARVERVQSIFEDSVYQFEVFVNDITGTFQDGEEIVNTEGTITAKIISKSGGLQSVIVIEGGSGHLQNDIVSITSASGSGGRGRINITANTALRTLTVTNAGSNFLRTEVVTISNLSRANTVNATAAPLLSVPIEFTGRYVDVKGFLSWSNKLQDNRYYQEFSYVLRSSQVLNTYREIVKDVVHPAGMRLFGDVLINVEIANAVTLDKQIVIITPNSLTDILIPEVISSSIGQYESSGEDGGVVPEPEVEIPTVPFVETAFNLQVPDTGSGFQLEIELIKAQTSALLAADEIITSEIIKLALGVTINETSQIAAIAIGNVYDPNAPSTDYLPTGSVWIVANGHYLTLANASDSEEIVAKPLHTMSTDVNVLRSFRIDSLPNTTVVSNNHTMVHLVDPTTIANTSIVPVPDANPSTGPQTITSTAVVSSNVEIYIQGAGLVDVDYFNASIAEVSNTQIAEYSDVITDATLNRIWVNGYGTDFINDINVLYINELDAIANINLSFIAGEALSEANNFKVLIKDIGNTGSFIYRDIELNAPFDANTLFLASNSNLTVINGEIHFIN